MRYGWLAGAVLLAGCGRPAVPAVPEIAPQASLDSSTAEAVSITFGEYDWPGWRGPTHDGVAPGPQPPTAWSETSGVVWAAKIPGRGHSSPIVLTDRVYLTTADERQQVQSVLAVDRRRGRLVWQTDVFQGGFERELHRENSQASCTLASDGERLFAVFLNDRRIWCSALSLEGEELWRTEVGGYRSKQGYSSSPVVYQSLVLLSADHSSGGFIAGLDRTTGEIVWRRNRPAKDSYSSPRVMRWNGGDAVVLSGCDQIAAYHPLTGQSLWTTPGTTESTVGTAVGTDRLVFVAGGYPDAGLVAVTPDGKIAWQNREKVYVPSMLVHGDALYAVRDDGVALCWDAATGKNRWKKRLSGDFRASPVAAGDLIYALDMTGKTTVFRANPERFDLVSENVLGTEAYASPAVSEGQLFLRIAKGERGDRQELLYCIGETAQLQRAARRRDLE